MDAEIENAERERLGMLDAVHAAIESRSQVVEAVFSSATREEALAAVQALLGVPERHAHAVIDIQFSRLTATARQKIERERDQIRNRLNE